MKLSYRILYKGVSAYRRMRFHHSLSVEKLRARFRRVSSINDFTLRRRYPKLNCLPFDLEGVPAEWMDANPGNEKPIVLYLHGGAYFMGGIDTHRGFALRLSYRCNVKVCTIDYRLAPENPYPAGLEDALKSYLWLRKNFPHQQIFIGGDSAGGGMTLACLMALRDKGEGQPDGAFCISPWTDLMGTGESLKSRKKRDCLLVPESITLWREFYCGSAHWKEPLVSPLYGSFKGLTRLQIYVGEEELLLDDAVRAAEKARQSGVDVELIREPDMQHDWPLLFHGLPEAKKAMEYLNKFLNA